MSELPPVGSKSAPPRRALTLIVASLILLTGAVVGGYYWLQYECHACAGSHSGQSGLQRPQRSHTARAAGCADQSTRGGAVSASAWPSSQRALWNV
jgi:hypothetical protein